LEPEAPEGKAADWHYVSPTELTASGAMQDRPAVPFSARTHEGERVESVDVLAKGPAVLVFIKAGCPCSAEFEPFFHALAGHYSGLVQFFGVINGDTETACGYARANRVPYPVLADPDRSVIKRFGVEKGGSVVLLRPTGVMDTLWPGCSRAMMQELGQRIAGLAGVEERPIEVGGLPAALTAGCPYSP
jgi:peroxiredoxin